MPASHSEGPGLEPQLDQLSFCSLLSTNHLAIRVLPPCNSINWFNSVVAITFAPPAVGTGFEPQLDRIIILR